MTQQDGTCWACDYCLGATVAYKNYWHCTDVRCALIPPTSTSKDALASRFSALVVHRQTDISGGGGGAGKRLPPHSPPSTDETKNVSIELERKLVARQSVPHLPHRKETHGFGRPQRGRRPTD